MTTTARKLTTVERVLGRPEYDIDLAGALEALRGERILITGALGSIGAAVRDALAEDHHDDAPERFATDLTEGVDVRSRDDVMDAFTWRPSVVLHLAGAKHAPEGELDPAGTVETNVIGTQNVLKAAATVGARVVTASTCKACDPETVYGATKLLAERMTLTAGGTVARFFNVVETDGNVFRTWEGLGEYDPVPVTPCARHFITLKEAVALVITAATLPSGRYAVCPGERPRPMPSVAAALYPDRPQSFIPVRRGDRLAEPMHAASERVRHLNEWLWQVTSIHDEVSA